MRPPGLPDDYTPVEHLASGGQADVWRVSRRTDGTSWVAKLYHSADPAHLGEALALSRLSHPAFPRIHGVSLTAGETHCLLIEHIPGETLDAWAAQHRGSATFATKATHVLTHLAAALAALHELDIAHRDLTPANVLLLPTFDEDPKRPGGLKLIDLGIATAVHERTRAGTRPFRAPESFVRDAPAGTGAQADVFAWGVLAVWLFSGRFSTGLSADASGEELRTRYEDPLELLDGLSAVPARLRVVVQRALRKLPSERLPSGPRLVDALRASEMPATEEERGSARDDAAPGVQALSAIVTTSEEVPARRFGVGRGRSMLIALAVAGAAVIVAGAAVAFGDAGRVCDQAAWPGIVRQRACEVAVGRGSYLDGDRARRLQILAGQAEARGDLTVAALQAAEGVGACRWSACVNVGAPLQQALDRVCQRQTGRSLTKGSTWGVVTARNDATGGKLRAQPWLDPADRGLAVTRGACLLVKGVVPSSKPLSAHEAFLDVELPDGRMGYMHLDMIAPVQRYVAPSPTTAPSR